MAAHAADSRKPEVTRCLCPADPRARHTIEHVDLALLRGLLRGGDRGTGAPGSPDWPNQRPNAAVAPDSPILLDSRQVAGLLGIGRTKVSQLMAKARSGSYALDVASACRDRAWRPGSGRGRPAVKCSGSADQVWRVNGETTKAPSNLRKEGLWVGAVSLPDGRRRAMYGRTRDEVRRKLAGALNARESGALTDARGQTLGQFLDTWLNEVAKPSVREWTYRGYEVHVRLHIKPSLGKVRLDRLEPGHVQALLNRKLKEGLSPASVRYIRGTLRTALQQAVRWGQLSRNVAALVDGPRTQHYEIKPLDAGEARRLLETLGQDRLRRSTPSH